MLLECNVFIEIARCAFRTQLRTKPHLVEAEFFLCSDCGPGIRSASSAIHLLKLGIPCILFRVQRSRLQTVDVAEIACRLPRICRDLPTAIEGSLILIELTDLALSSLECLVLLGRGIKLSLPRDVLIFSGSRHESPRLTSEKTAACFRS